MTIIQTLRRRIFAPTISAAAIITTLGMTSPASAEPSFGSEFGLGDLANISLNYTESIILPEQSIDAPFDNTALSNEKIRRQTLIKKYDQMIKEGKIKSAEEVDEYAQLYLALGTLSKILKSPNFDGESRKQIHQIESFFNTRWPHQADAASALCLINYERYLSQMADLTLSKDGLDELTKTLTGNCIKGTNGGNPGAAAILLELVIMGVESDKDIQEAIMLSMVLNRFGGKSSKQANDAEPTIRLMASEEDWNKGRELFSQCERKGYLNCFIE